MEIKDSGNRRDFGTGAVRDIAEGKGRCDLLPLEVISSMHPDFVPLRHIEEYIRTGHLECLVNAIEIAFDRDTDSAGWADLFLGVALHYEAGANKYSERNWENGIPLHCFIDSGVRHFLKWKRGDLDEPHSRAFAWNLLGAIWTHLNHSDKPELMDLPFCALPNPDAK